MTITDSNDIIFRLAYFERKHQFFNIDDLTSEMTRHYTSQAIKQMYVILLGLDVIGNPFGLAVGVARSVENLFYEPFQVKLSILFSSFLLSASSRQKINLYKMSSNRMLCLNGR